LNSDRLRRLADVRLQDVNLPKRRRGEDGMRIVGSRSVRRKSNSSKKQTPSITNDKVVDMDDLLAEAKLPAKAQSHQSAECHVMGRP